ncbi:MAG: hypothetical protein ABSH46_15325 [Bryobacteraceae bacterium]
MHKRRKIWIVAAPLAAALLAGSWACKKEEAEQDENLPPASVVAVAQPRARRQLLDGFWAVENNSWRWTKHRFSVLLMAPPGAAQGGASLEFRFTLPDPVILRRKSVTLSASVGEVALPPETYTSSGTYLYKADVPATAFTGQGPVRVAFATDKYLAAGEVEGRELALVAKSIGLTPK